ncbi:hypothetical protein [Parasegetibacter sp. NRK P23]|uniref:hypothetical protein n=1 Tax=Parasegetibacter sp. NRK P23 TaxID=2942999 RepID=UPI002042EEEC|nr:hypothetical protein [Parasegetibacter sp. NRK P23]MCM5528982.1 hypothetical protein [Parasegetibacter sp. NRK P23]
MKEIQELLFILASAIGSIVILYLIISSASRSRSIQRNTEKTAMLTELMAKQLGVSEDKIDGVNN